MSDEIRCPKCLSENVRCEPTKKAHKHSCNDCGYTTTAAAKR